jgi:hypothetical protein
MTIINATVNEKLLNENLYFNIKFKIFPFLKISKLDLNLPRIFFSQSLKNNKDPVNDYDESEKH